MSPIDAETLKIEKWADAGDRTDPDDPSLTPTLTRAQGWPSSFSATDGDTPRRRPVNQLYRELTGLAVDVRDQGLLAWDTDIDYLQHAITHVDGVHVPGDGGHRPSHQQRREPGHGRTDGMGHHRGRRYSSRGAEGAHSGNPREWRARLVLELPGGRRQRGHGVRLPVARCRDNRLVGVGCGRVRAHRADWSGERDGYPGGASWLARRSVRAPGRQLVPRHRRVECPMAGRRSRCGRTRVTRRPSLTGWSPTTVASRLRATRCSGAIAVRRSAPARRASVTETEHTVIGLRNDTEYFFRVRAVNGQGPSAWSNEASATPAEAIPDEAIPDQADAPSSDAGNGEITWYWNAPSDNGADITGYDFRRRVFGGSWQTIIAVGAPFRNETGTNGTIYEAQVRARNSVGTQTAWSPFGTATPQAEVPDAVQFVSLENTTSAIDADWGEPEANGSAILDYTIQTDDNSAFSSPTSATTTSSNRTFTGVSEGDTLYVRVRARNARGSGAWSPTTSLVRDNLRAAPGAPERAARRPSAQTADRPVVEWGANSRQRRGQSPGTSCNGGVAGDRVVRERRRLHAAASWTTVTVADDDHGSRMRRAPEPRTAECTSLWSADGQPSPPPTCSTRCLTSTVDSLASQAFAWPYADASRAVVAASGGARRQGRRERHKPWSQEHRRERVAEAVRDHLVCRHGRFTWPQPTTRSRLARDVTKDMIVLALPSNWAMAHQRDGTDSMVRYRTLRADRIHRRPLQQPNARPR